MPPGRAGGPGFPSAAGPAAALIGPRPSRPACGVAVVGLRVRPSSKAVKRRMRRRADARRPGPSGPASVASGIEAAVGRRYAGSRPRALAGAGAAPAAHGRSKGGRRSAAGQGRGMIAPRDSRAGRRRMPPYGAARTCASCRPKARACRRATGAEGGRIRRASILATRRLPIAARRDAGGGGREMRAGGCGRATAARRGAHWPGAKSQWGALNPRPFAYKANALAGLSYIGARDLGGAIV